MVEAIKKVIQGTKEWFALRMGRITGTRIQRAVKEDIWVTSNPWESLAIDMFREENGLPQIPFDSRALYAISRGKENEPKAIQTLKDMGYEIVDSPFVVHPDHDWLGMSPDGILVRGRNGNVSAVEIKCPQTKPVSDVKKQKRNYWHQMQLGMECMDIDEMLFFQWYETGEHFQEWVNRDPEWASIYIPKAKEFMDWYKEAKKDPENIARWSIEYKEPGVPYKDIEDNDETSQLAKVMLDIKVAQQKLKDLDAVKKKLSEKLINEHNGAFRTPSVKCHLTQATGRIDYKRLIEDKEIPVHEIEGYRSEGATRIYTRLMEAKDGD